LLQEQQSLRSVQELQLSLWLQEPEWQILRAERDAIPWFSFPELQSVWPERLVEQ
jgi:hypothetical protein